VTSENTPQTFTKGTHELLADSAGQQEETIYTMQTLENVRDSRARQRMKEVDFSHISLSMLKQ